MATIYDVSAQTLIEETAKSLKEDKVVEMPKWAEYVKTGVHKERKPQNDGWWYVRSASVLRRIYIEGPVGVERLRTFYGGRKNRGRRPEKFKKSSGKIIRTILKQLDEKGMTLSGKTGRTITAAGQSYLDKISSEMNKKTE